MLISVRNNGGFSLVELMVAMLISLVGLLGLVQAMTYAAQQNFQTQQRDEAVQIAEVWMAQFHSVPYGNAFSLISTCAGCSDGRYKYAPVTVQSRLRSGNGSYTVLRSTTVGSGGSYADLGVKVSWKFKNNSTAHEVHSIRFRDAN